MVLLRDARKVKSMKFSVIMALLAFGSKDPGFIEIFLCFQGISTCCYGCSLRVTLDSLRYRVACHTKFRKLWHPTTKYHILNWIFLWLKFEEPYTAVILRMSKTEVPQHYLQFWRIRNQQFLSHLYEWGNWLASHHDELYSCYELLWTHYKFAAKYLWLHLQTVFRPWSSRSFSDLVRNITRRNTNAFLF